MTKTVIQLITEWAAFDEQYPGSDLQSFCRYVLSQPASVANKSRAESVGQLARIIGRLSSAYALYHRAAMEGAKLPATDSFYYLLCLSQLGEVRKTELINYLFAETTTGMEHIGKLIKGGYIKERPDPNDGRAKLITISDKGIKKLKECMPNAQKVNEMVFKHLSDNTILTVIQLLQSSEAIHSKRSVELKQKPFSEMYREMMAE